MWVPCTIYRVREAGCNPSFLGSLRLLGENFLEGVGEARKVQRLRFAIGLGSTLLWSYMLNCLLLRDVGVWFSALSVELGSMEHLGHSLPAHIGR